MAMSEEEILREAGRIRANRRLRVAKQCERCGNGFEGLSRAKYCSDACRMAASRERVTRPAPHPGHILYVEGTYPGESTRDYVIRMRKQLVAAGKMTSEAAELTPADEEWFERTERMDRMREETFKKFGRLDDSVELIRQMREERSEQSLKV